MRLPASENVDQAPKQPPQQVLVYPSAPAGTTATPPSPGTPVLQSPGSGPAPAGAPQTYLLGVPSHTQLAQLLPPPGPAPAHPLQQQQQQQRSPQEGSPQQSFTQMPAQPSPQQMVVMQSGASSTASGDNTPRQRSLNDSFNNTAVSAPQVLVALPRNNDPALPNSSFSMPITQEQAPAVTMAPQAFFQQQQQLPHQQLPQPPASLQATKLMAPPAFAQQAAQQMNKPPATQLIVNFISSSVSEKDLKRLFEKYGEVENVKILYDKATAKTKGFGFVYFTEYQSAAEAMKGLQGYELKGKCIKVGWANQRQPRASVSAPVPVPVPVPIAGGQVAQMMPPPTLFGSEATPYHQTQPSNLMMMPQMPVTQQQQQQPYSGQPQFIHFGQQS